MDNMYDDNIYDDDDGESRCSKGDYIILREDEIAQLEEDAITEVSSLLCISKSEACLLLTHFKWRVDVLEDNWFVDEDKVREKTGLLKKPIVEHSTSGETCGICFEEYCYYDALCNPDIGSSKRDMALSAAACGHNFCHDCWTGYISTSICDGGSACLMLRCPEPSCTAAVGPDLILNVLLMTRKKEEYDRYKRYLLRSYVLDNRKIKWCPAPDCKYAIKFESAPDRMTSCNVTCVCSHSYCWNCGEENHHPVDCETARKWILKNENDSQGQWIIVHTKPCPKCRTPIEKNTGCMHMTCRAPCLHEFCWLCLGSYRTPRHHCNRFGKKKETTLQFNSGDLERYLHFYERWENNGKSKEKALKDFDKVKTVRIKQLGDIKIHTDQENEYDFIVQAWQQIIECRKVLRWTYAYGFYINENDHAKRELFECLQDHAGFSLERLHKCAESEMQQFLVASSSTNKRDPTLLQEFKEFEIKLTSLTKVTRTYFNKLVTALEEGLPEILYKNNKKPKKGHFRSKNSRHKHNS